MKKKIIGNWKCNQILSDVVNFADTIKEVNFKNDFEIGIAIPNVWLFVAKTYFKDSINIYAQDVDYIPFGSYTARTSYQHLENIGIKNVIIGHSETRLFSNNSDYEINKKIEKALSQDFNVVLCIGETIDTYNKKQTDGFLLRQIANALKDIDKTLLKKITIAYEPIWAIGTNKTPSNEEIEMIITIIKQFGQINYETNFDVLYGGSVNLDNINYLSTIPNLDGFLIGTASLNAKQFINLIERTKWNVS